MSAHTNTGQSWNANLWLASLWRHFSKPSHSDAQKLHSVPRLGKKYGAQMNPFTRWRDSFDNYSPFAVLMPLNKELTWCGGYLALRNNTNKCWLVPFGCFDVFFRWFCFSTQYNICRAFWCYNLVGALQYLFTTWWGHCTICTQHYQSHIIPLIDRLLGREWIDSVSQVLEQM